MQSGDVVIAIDTLGMPTRSNAALSVSTQYNAPLANTAVAPHAVKEVKDAATPLSVVSLGSEIENAQETCCRICMETIKNTEFEEFSALRLGCKCLDGLDVVHLNCAQKWFRLKRSLSCEICGFPAKNLPEKFRKKLQRRIEQMNQVGFRSDDEDAVERFALLETRQPQPWTVFLYGFLPTLVSFLILISFFHQFLGIAVGTCAVLSGALALVTFIHFLIERHQHPWHILFVLLYLGTILSIATIFHGFYGWEAVPAAAGGALIGPVTATGFFAALKTTLTLCSPAYHIFRVTLV